MDWVLFGSGWVLVSNCSEYGEEFSGSVKVIPLLDWFVAVQMFMCHVTASLVRKQKRLTTQAVELFSSVNISPFDLYT